MVKDIKIQDFDYPLPDERIPRHPLQQRDACKLLVANPGRDIRHTLFSDLPSLLAPGSMLVCNDTKVINARLEFHKSTGSRIEVFLLEPIDPADYVLTFQSRRRCVWSCLVGNLKRWKEGALVREVAVEGHASPVTLSANRLYPAGGNAQAVEFSWDNPEVTFAQIVEAAGKIPIPPYLKRDTEDTDLSDYQTVYANAKGSVAAPTAGLHFTPAVFDGLKKRGIEVRKVTLHVGAGTFQPVKSSHIGDHPMHTETFTVTRSLISGLIAHLQSGSPLAAVGTTTVRTLESLPYLGIALMQGKKDLHVTQWEAYEPKLQSIDTLDALRAIETHMKAGGIESLTASTAIMIAPGFRWRLVDAMVTNFHQPQSTLLLLVSSFLGNDGAKPRWRKIYDEALSGGYRFLSYGDACLFFRKGDDPVRLPLSKSIGARMLVASYFAGTLGQCPRLEGCDDLEAIQQALLELEINREWLDAGWPPLDVHASGTAFRLVAAAAASTPGADFLLTGTPRLCARPMAPLLDVLRTAGAKIEAQGSDGTGPYHILGRRLKGGDFEIRGDVSSQFISALMLGAPTWNGGMKLKFTTPLVSQPYARMTADVMHRFGVSARLTEGGVEVPPGEYLAPQNFSIEADWSAAGFFYEAASLMSTPVTVEGLTPPAESLQGDSRTAAIFASLGVSTEFKDNVCIISQRHGRPGRLDIDLTDNPDLAPALAVACAAGGTQFCFSGVRNLRLKESDRLAALCNELAKLGFRLSEGDDTLEWNGETVEPQTDPVIETYDDHRIAMAFAMAAIAKGSIRIEHPEVVEKSFAGFWRELPKIGLLCKLDGDIMTVASHLSISSTSSNTRQP